MTMTAQTTRGTWFRNFIDLSVVFRFEFRICSVSYEAMPLPFPSPKLTSWCWVTTTGVMAPDDDDRFATESSPFRRATADSSSLSRASRIPRSEGVDGPASRSSAAAGATRGEGNMGGS